MLVIKIELWPRGDRTKAREIGRTYIANVGGDTERGDYEAAVCRRGTTSQLATDPDWYHRTPMPLDPSGPKATRTGSVHDYPRQSYNVWRLVIRALLSCFPEERP
jgi:hypothetical protein